MGGYRIKYVLNEDTLHLYAGWKLAFSIPLRQIVDGEKAVRIARLSGWGLNNAGLCNRFRNGLCFNVHDRRQYRLYLSPSDPDMFLEQVIALKQRLEDG